MNKRMLSFRNRKAFHEDTSTGFGQTASNQGRRFIKPNGDFNVTRTGQAWKERFYLFHTLTSISWWSFLGVVLGFYFVLNLLFTSLYFAMGTSQFMGLVHTEGWDLFFELFNYSSQTVTTVGYGRVNPVGHIASFLASAEALVGLLSFALITGLLYGRFSRPHSVIQFSENILVAPYRGGRGLMFRLANKRSGLVMEPEISVIASLMLEENGVLVRRFFDLPLERSKITYLALSWTVVHELNEESPLGSLTPDEVEAMDIEILIQFKGHDSTYAQQLYSNYSYKYEDMVWNAKFLSAYEPSASGEQTVLHLDRLNRFQKLDT